MQNILLCFLPVRFVPRIVSGAVCTALAQTEAIGALSMGTLQL
jgi:hypothetical protein